MVWRAWKFAAVLSVLTLLLAVVTTQGQPTFQRTAFPLKKGAKGFKVASVETNLAMTGAALDKAIVEKLGGVAVPAGQKYRVAVFKFGDKDWKYPLAMGNNGIILQGSMVNDLQTLMANEQKFTLLLPDQLDQVLSTGNTDPQGLSGSNLNLARKLMQQFTLDVCVFGRFLKDDAANGKVPVKATIVTQAQSFDIEANVDGAELDTSDAQPDKPISGRFDVRFEVKLDEASDEKLAASWTPIKLKKKMAPTTENLFFLVLNQNVHKGKRYRMIVENKGAPAVGESASDKDRVFGTVVFIDGVSHVLQKRGAVFGPQTGHPLDMPKEVLTAPGRFLKEDQAADNTRFKGGVITDGNNNHHLREIVGFQKGLDTAGAFRFGEPANSPGAELLGPVSKLGTIQVFFYPEIFDDDGYLKEVGTQSTPSGTMLGEDVPSKRFKLDVKNWFNLPAETWNIVYRYEGDPAIPPPPLQDYP
jgi:hypothetical protein